MVLVGAPIAWRLSPSLSLYLPVSSRSVSSQSKTIGMFTVPVSKSLFSDTIGMIAIWLLLSLLGFSRRRENTTLEQQTSTLTQTLDLSNTQLVNWP